MQQMANADGRARPSTEADGTAADDRLFQARVPVLRHGFGLWRWIRRRLSRRQLSIRLLNLPVSKGTADRPGLIVLQIDGLAHDQLLRALHAGRLPFLQRLLLRDNYRILPMYSGQPATTPAVLGELFYGVPQAVPAYSFRDHRSGEVVEMVQHPIAAAVQSELEPQGGGLLEGGSAYCDIYSGGALESHFCPANMGWEALQDQAAWRKAAIYALNIGQVLRMLVRLPVEFAHAVYEALTSEIGRREFIHELKFLPRRLIGGVAIRDLVAIAAEIDATRGLPAMHANFVGYDELAHRRGPGSAYAHRGLKTIDRAVQRIWRAAQASHRRDYHVWIMADHGQEQTTWYEERHGRSVNEAIAEVYRRMTGRPSPGEAEDDGESADPLTVAIGPIGHVYCAQKLSAETIERLGVAFSRELQIPIVMARLGDQTAAWAEGRRFHLPGDAAELLGHAHPHLAEVSRDLANLCTHVDAGQLVICGYRAGSEPITFVAEHGAHGGPGPQETSGFLMIPAEDAELVREPLRPSAVREMAMAVLQRGPASRRPPSARPPRAPVKIVTYNVHSCVGLDGRLSPARIARVLAALDPDVVALQELDVGRQRSRGIDQAQSIADALRMSLHFLPCLEITGEKYGNAVLSRLPMEVIAAGRLPGLHDRFEPRGVLWVQIDCDDRPLNLLTTHLSFNPLERRAQVDALLGPQWIGHPDCRGPLVVCGDFNAGPRSYLYQQLTRNLRDAQLCLPQRSPQRTWFSPLPLSRIDHVFVSDALTVMDVTVAHSQMARIASDHLPVCVTVDVPVTAAAAAPEIASRTAIAK